MAGALAAVDVQDFAGGLLFPASIAKPGSRRCATMDARTTVSINQDIEAFIAWVDATFTGSAGAPAIQPDPAGRIYSTRLRPAG